MKRPDEVRLSSLLLDMWDRRPQPLARTATRFAERPRLGNLLRRKAAMTIAAAALAGCVAHNSQEVTWANAHPGDICETTPRNQEEQIKLAHLLGQMSLTPEEYPYLIIRYPDNNRNSDGLEVGGPLLSRYAPLCDRLEEEGFNVTTDDPNATAPRSPADPAHK